MSQEALSMTHANDRDEQRTAALAETSTLPMTPTLIPNPNTLSRGERRTSAMTGQLGRDLKQLALVVRRAGIWGAGN